MSMKEVTDIPLTSLMTEDGLYADPDLAPSSTPLVLSRNQKIAVGTLIAVAALAGAILAIVSGFFIPPVRAVVRFGIIGDFGRQGQDNQTATANAMAQFCSQYGCQFLISTGDNFYPNGVSSVNDPAWKESFQDVYSQRSLYHPWIISVGNVDYHGNVSAQVARGSMDNRWYMPNRYYVMPFGVPSKFEARLIMLDTTPLLPKQYLNDTRINQEDYRQQSASAQLEWLREILSEPSDYDIVIGHHPMYSCATDHGDDPELQNALLVMLQEANVPLYIAGHSHTLQHISTGPYQTQFFISGAGSRVHTGFNESYPYANWHAGVNGFIGGHINSVELQLEFVSSWGEVLKTVTIPRRKRRSRF